MARELAQRGHGVVLVARSEERLRALAGELATAHGVRAEAVACDVTDPAARDRLEAEVARLGLRVDVLVNNAGFGTYEPFVETPRERVLAEVRVNTEAVADLTGRRLPRPGERGAGAVLITASTAGFQPLPGNAVYSSGKAFGPRRATRSAPRACLLRSRVGTESAAGSRPAPCRSGGGASVTTSRASR